MFPSTYFHPGRGDHVNAFSTPQPSRKHRIQAGLLAKRSELTPRLPYLRKVFLLTLCPYRLGRDSLALSLLCQTHTLPPRPVNKTCILAFCQQWAECWAWVEAKPGWTSPSLQYPEPGDIDILNEYISLRPIFRLFVILNWKWLLLVSDGGVSHTLPHPTGRNVNI